MVDVELSMEANDETMAADRAATTNPLSPTGINVLISQG